MKPKDRIETFKHCTIPIYNDVPRPSPYELFMGLDDNGAAKFQDSSGYGDAYSFDERSCVLRLQNLKERCAGMPRAIREHKVYHTQLALHAIQDFKTQRGIPLDTPDARASTPKKHPFFRP